MPDARIIPLPTAAVAARPRPVRAAAVAVAGVTGAFVGGLAGMHIGGHSVGLFGDIDQGTGMLLGGAATYTAGIVGARLRGHPIVPLRRTLDRILD